MNAVVDTPAGVPRPAGSTPIHRTHRFRWLLRREFWEHKGGFFWAPLITGAVFLLFTLIGGGTGQYIFERHGGKVINIDGQEVPLSQMNWGEMLSKASPEDLRQLHDVINGSTLLAATWPVLVFGIVVFFYLLGCLYDERKDRSVLFWKSLPVSDRDTVLSKLATALVVGPLLASLIGIATMIGFGLVLSLFILLNGANPFTLYWGQLDFFRLVGTMLGWIPLYALWALPTAGWLMLCSAWAKSKPFLWAIVLPVGAGCWCRGSACSGWCRTARPGSGNTWSPASCWAPRPAATCSATWAPRTWTAWTTRPTRCSESRACWSVHTCWRRRRCGSVRSPASR